MTRPVAWITAAVLGAAGNFVLSFGMLELIVFAALTIAVGVVGGRATWVAGFLTGFGGMWLLLVARSAGSCRGGPATRSPTS